MAVSVLQREALARTEQFVQQVNGTAVTQALYKYETIQNLSDGEKQQLTQVPRSPQSYGFVQTILCDAAWAITYDVWAADPSGQDGAILAAVDKVWTMLVGTPSVP